MKKVILVLTLIIYFSTGCYNRKIDYYHKLCDSIGLTKPEVLNATYRVEEVVLATMVQMDYDYCPYTLDDAIIEVFPFGFDTVCWHIKQVSIYKMPKKQIGEFSNIESYSKFFLEEYAKNRITIQDSLLKEMVDNKEYHNIFPNKGYHREKFNGIHFLLNKVKIGYHYKGVECELVVNYGNEIEGGYDLIRKPVHVYQVDTVYSIQEYYPKKDFCYKIENSISEKR